MIRPVPISDGDLNDVLLKAGLTLDEIETEPEEVRQIVKIVLGAVTAVVLDKLVQRIFAEAMK